MDWLCDAKVPVFFKQLGTKQFNPVLKDPTIVTAHPSHAKVGFSLNGRVLERCPKDKRRYLDYFKLQKTFLLLESKF